MTQSPNCSRYVASFVACLSRPCCSYINKSATARDQQGDQENVIRTFSGHSMSMMAVSLEKVPLAVALKNLRHSVVP